METYRLKVKIGSHEFDAEGSPKDVKAQFEEWKKLIVTTSLSPSALPDVGKAFPAQATGTQSSEGLQAPWGIFNIDSKRKLVTLLAHPTGESRDADAALLVLYGYKQTLGQDEVPVTKLKESLEVSGLRPDRIDRTLSIHVKAGFILKTGRAKGGRYRLTNTGYSHADAMARKLGQQLAH